MYHKDIIGVDLGGTNLRAGKVSRGQLGPFTTAAVSSQAAEQIVCRELIDIIAGLFDSHTEGIGVAVPSVVDAQQGIVYAVENIPSWKEVHLKEILEHEFDVPVSINNDANAFALGELYFGAGLGCQDLVGITVGTGLGAGIVIDGKLHDGRNCGAGEIGCIPYRKHTLEYYCSGSGLERIWGMSGSDLYSMACEGDSRALDIFHEFGLLMGDAVTIALLCYDPQIIVIGGSVSRSFSFFQPSMMKRLQSFPYQKVIDRIRIMPTSDTRNPILGAVALHLDKEKKNIH